MRPRWYTASSPAILKDARADRHRRECRSVGHRPQGRHSIGIPEGCRAASGLGLDENAKLEALFQKMEVQTCRLSGMMGLVDSWPPK